MKVPKPARALLWAMAALAVLAAFAVLDWYPTVRELGRQRRQRGDLAAKMKNYAAMAAGFVFADAGEESLFRRGAKQLRRSLPPVDDDAAWAAIALLEIQARVAEDGIAHARVLFSPQAQGTEIGTPAPGRPDLLADWLFSRQAVDMGKGFAAAADADGYPWHGVLSGLETRGGERPASRALGVALAAPLPALLNFINHVSWGAARLEIVRLRFEPGIPLSRAWLVCRGSFLTRKPSSAALKIDLGKGDESFLVDPDSPLLLQRIDPLLAPRFGKRELPPAPSMRGDAAGSPW